jgi:hypothetical protein
LDTEFLKKKIERRQIFQQRESSTTRKKWNAQSGAKHF